MIFARINPMMIVYVVVIFFVNMDCPGVNPWRIKAPKRTAATVDPGIPNVMSGMILPPVTALFAVSDAQIASSDPSPNSSGCFMLFRLAVSKPCTDVSAGTRQDSDNHWPMIAERIKFGPNRAFL